MNGLPGLAVVIFIIVIAVIVGFEAGRWWAEAMRGSFEARMAWRRRKMYRQRRKKREPVSRKAHDPRLYAAAMDNLEPIEELEDVFGRISKSNLRHDYPYSTAINYSAARPRSSTLLITIYLSDESVHEQVEAAVEDLLESVGGHIEHRDDPMFGSWFRQMRARIGRATRSPLGREATILATHATESRLIHAQDATVTATMMQNLGPVLTALQPTKDAVIRAGALLIVKVDGVVMVHQLTPAQQLKLAHQPQLAQSPRDLLAALELQADNLAEDPGTLGSATDSTAARPMETDPGPSQGHVK